MNKGGIKTKELFDKLQNENESHKNNQPWINTFFFWLYQNMEGNK